VQLAAIAHSRLWHIATLRYDAQIRSLLEALRTCHERHERSGATRLTHSGSGSYLSRFTRLSALPTRSAPISLAHLT
jgi:hypothetical protein